MLYFSSSPIDPEKIDLQQYQRLKDFKEKMRPLGLVEGYTNPQDFREKFAHQLNLHLEKIISGVSIVPEKYTEKQKNEILKNDSVFIEDYEKNGEIKSFLVKGNTAPIKNDLKELGGKWNNSLKGWIFPKSYESSVAEFLKKHR